MSHEAETVVDQVLAALADPTRRRLLDVLGTRPGCSATSLADELPISRQAVVKHLTLLERAGLVTSRRDGREVLFTAAPEPLTTAASWMTTLAATWQERLDLLKAAAEAEGNPDTTAEGEEER